MTPQEALHVYVSAFVDELGRSGVHNVVICPGSRSTPLAMVFAEQQTIKIWMHVDERSAAFFALGMAKASGEPVAILCTSGTAAANFMPAVVEAHYSNVPLIILTADRPSELRDVGAAQTIDQIKLYGSHVKWYMEMALPEATPELIRYVRATACRAVAESQAGSVHLNFPFREPLVPIRAGEGKWYERQEDQKPSIKAVPGTRTQLDLVILPINHLMEEKGLLVCGPDAFVSPDLLKISQLLNYPMLIDPLSDGRCREFTQSDLLIDAYDAFLRDNDFIEKHAPSIIVRFGAIPTSKPLLQYLQRYVSCEHLLVSGWDDPFFLATTVVDTNTKDFCRLWRQVVEKLDQRGRLPQPTAWASSWIDANRITRQAINDKIAGFTEPFEGRVFSELAEILPKHSTLYVGSSMPVRDLDTFFPAVDKNIHFLANRGANGIDGVVSSALGASTATKGPLVLVIGDLSFYHDMNGLLAAKLHKLNATIIVINNDGGGIFSFLPQAAYPEHFELLYGTPHGLDFRHTADLYGATYHRMTWWDDFREAMDKALNSDGLKIIEVPTNRERNVEMHRAIWPAVSEALKPILTSEKSS